MTDDLYSEGMRIAATLHDLDGPNVNPLCHTRVYTHGRRVERSLLLLHGFTNCPSSSMRSAASSTNVAGTCSSRATRDTATPTV